MIIPAPKNDNKNSEKQQEAFTEKHLKKLAALLLVGVLALSLLTAAAAAVALPPQMHQAETAVMAAINQNRSDKLQNSSELRETAKRDLDAAIKFGNLSSSF